MPPRRKRILICDDDESFRGALARYFAKYFDVEAVASVELAWDRLAALSFDLLILDVQFKKGGAEPTLGHAALPKLRSEFPALPVVMLSGGSDYPVVREAMVAGARDFLRKDSEPEVILHVIKGILGRAEAEDRLNQKDFEIKRDQSKHAFVGTHPSVERLRRLIERARPADINVLITGEMGTGKEVVARLLRRTPAVGADALEPFVAVDSATIQASMAESLLFGYERGAFTGADKTTRGLFEEAHGGTIYFDEIGNMPLAIQTKLLRILQEKECLRLGASRPIPLEFRVIAATNADLDALVAQGLFKQDLLERLNVFPIHIPALRERREDVPLLIQHFSERLARRKPLEFSTAALKCLMAYAWPGNVRELANLVAYLNVALEQDGRMVQSTDLPAKFGRIAESAEKITADYYAQVEAFERRTLVQAISRHQGSLSSLALQLGVDRSHLYKKLKTLGISPKAASVD